MKVSGQQSGVCPGYVQRDKNGLQRTTGSRILRVDEKTGQMNTNDVTMLQENIV